MTISTGHYFVLPPAFPHIEESCAIHEIPQDVTGIGSCRRVGMRRKRERTATTLETLFLRGSQNWSTGLLCWATVISLYFPGMFTIKTCWHVAHRTSSMTQTSLTCTSRISFLFFVFYIHDYTEYNQQWNFVLCIWPIQVHTHLEQCSLM